MKKIKKRYGLIFGAAVITLLMVSSVTAINVVQLDVKESNDVYVDPNIRLTRLHLPILKNALKSVDNTDIQIIINGIIQLLKNTNTIDKKDILQIIANNDIQKAKVYGLASISTEGGELGGFSGGNLYCLPGNFRSLLVYISKGGVGYWHAYTTDDYLGHYIHPYLIINGDLFDYEHRGLAIGLFGICSKQIGNLPGTFYMFAISGIALMVITI